MPLIILVAGAAILFFLQRILYKKLWDKGLDIDIRFQERSAFEGEKGTLMEILENRNFLPLPFLHAKFEIGSGLVFENGENVSTSDRNYKNDIFSVLFYQRVTRRLPFVCRKRGYYTITSADLVSTDLFYTEHMVRAFKQRGAAFYVYPGPVDTSLFEQPLRKLIGDMTSRQFIYPDPFEFKGLRNYTVSDPMNTINWKASARTGELMVNQYDSTTSRRIVILLNLVDETVVQHQPLHEEAMRIAATLAAHMLHEGYPVRLVTNGRDVETGETLQAIAASGAAQAEDIYRSLARVDLARKMDDFAPYVDCEMEDPDYANAGYILISSNMEQELQESFALLSKEAAGMWVVPLYDNMDFHPAAGTSAEIIRWEVKGHA